MKCRQRTKKMPTGHRNLPDDPYSTVLWAVGAHCGIPMLDWFWWRNSRGSCHLCGERDIAKGPPSKVSRLLVEHARYHVNLLGRDKVMAIAGALAANGSAPVTPDILNLAIELVADVLGPAPLPGIHMPWLENAR